MSAMLADTLPDKAMAVVETPRSDRKRVVIVGGGFAGVAAAHALRRSDAKVVLIDRRNHHIFQPLLYQVATAVLSPAEIAAPIRQLEAKRPNVTILLAEVIAMDVASRVIEASSPGVGILKIAFDYLVVATGKRPSYFGHDEFARYAPGLKSLNDAETIRGKILGAFELAATTEDEAERARQMTFVLVGAGPTGVELAGSLAHLVKVTLRGNFHRIDPAKASIILLDAGKRVLPTFAESLSHKVAGRLEKLGVKVVTNVKVETVDGNGVIARRKQDPKCDSAVDRGGRGIADSKDARY
jgi:NADH dehydrogenase